METSRATVRAAIAASTHGARETLIESLEEHLFRRSFAAASKVLVLEMAAARRRGLLAGESSEERFAFFCECLADPSFASRLLAQYPALTGRLVKLVANWEAASVEMLQRLACDWKVIRAAMFGGDNPGALTAAEPLGDSHAQGRCVHRLIFAAGHKLIYKPRPVGMEYGFHHFVQWLNGKGQTPHLDALIALDRGAYGWTQFREPAPCTSRAGVRRFFRRQGANMAVAHLLGGSDLHYENVLAAGEFPVIVDLETLFHDPTPAPRLARAGAEAFQIVSDSVRRTLLLPVKVASADISALGFADGQEAPYVAHDWADWDADTMHMAERRGVLPAAHCLPVLAGKPVPASDHVEEIGGGFSDTYDLMLRHKKELPRALDVFRGRAIRRVFRPTSSYVQVLQQSWHPEVAHQTSVLNTLLREALAPGDIPRAERSAVLKAERSDLINGDIPYFLARLGKSRGSGALASAGWNACLTRAKSLSQTDKERQLWITRLSFVDPNGGLPNSRWRVREPSAAALLETAEKIGERICELAIVNNGRANWLFPLLDEQLQLVPAVMGVDLYDGLAGVALFLAQLFAATGKARFRAMAEAALGEAWDMLSILEKERIRAGGFEGSGGLAYAMAHCGTLLKRPDWLRKAVRLIAKEAKAQNDAVDLIAGRAGFLSCGTAVATLANAPALLEALRPCALSLSKQSMPGEKDAGLAHGRAGVALALLRWSAGRSARKLLLEDLDVSRHDGGAWCRGGVGTALAGLRLGLDVGLQAREVVAATMELLSTLKGDAALCLCHGLFGILEFMEAAAAHGVPGAREGFALVRREAVSRAVGGEFGSDHAHRLESPALMKGLAGTGYALLRLVRPGPSVLTLDP